MATSTASIIGTSGKEPVLLEKENGPYQSLDFPWNQDLLEKSSEGDAAALVYASTYKTLDGDNSRMWGHEAGEFPTPVVKLPTSPQADTGTVSSEGEHCTSLFTLFKEICHDYEERNAVIKAAVQAELVARGKHGNA